MKRISHIAAVLGALALAGTTAAGGFQKAGNVPDAPQQPAAGYWLPTDAWQDAVRAGGEVRLGAGTFDITSLLELDRSVRVTGMGPEVTVLSFAGDGGEYGEQLALLARDGGERFHFADLGMMQSNEVRSDLVSVVGEVTANFENVSLGLAWDNVLEDQELENYYGVGIYGTAGANVRIVNSTVYGNGTHGVAVWDSTLFVNNTEFVVNWVAGIMAVDSEVTVINSTFDRNYVGIEIYGSLPRTLANNTFTDNELEDVYEGE